MTTDSSAFLASKVKEHAEKIYPEVVALRRDIHAHPELSYEERRTTALIVEYLERVGIAIEPSILETGVIAVIRGKKAGGERKLVALRADIDALPLNEENDHGFCSMEPGKMHACGHDM
ncbi:MAG: amidohydrolase, partial [Chlorobiaceae bacterium]|nr:amidohydrolase [Chlorobiaceae bacterium]